MADCLADLSTELSAKGLEPGRYSVHGLSVEDSQLVYAWDQAFCDHVDNIEQRAVLINHVENDTDPAPLGLLRRGLSELRDSRLLQARPDRASASVSSM